jgi:predicted secreted protein
MALQAENSKDALLKAAERADQKLHSCTGRAGNNQCRAGEQEKTLNFIKIHITVKKFMSLLIF